MDWRSLLQRSCASTILRISELSVVLEDSTIFMVPLVHGRVSLSYPQSLLKDVVLALVKLATLCTVAQQVAGRRLRLHFAERLLLLQTSLRCGVMVFKRDLLPSLMNV